ncbi:MAG: hypothetical protein KDD43_00305 [Bdellovibrionales bacterium]|nr:hypothetical protein [Bdellovibrionales bacterium]
MGWIKLALKIFGGLIVVGVIALGLFAYSASSTARKKSHIIEELGKVPLGATVEEVMVLAEKLGIDIEGSEFAIPSVLEMRDDDNPRGNKDLPERVDKRTDLSKFLNGTLNFGLSLFLFSRMGCEISFKDGKVKSTRIWQLD